MDKIFAHIPYPKTEAALIPENASNWLFEGRLEVEGTAKSSTVPTMLLSGHLNILHPTKTTSAINDHFRCSQLVEVELLGKSWPISAIGVFYFPDIIDQVTIHISLNEHRCVALHSSALLLLSFP